MKFSLNWLSRYVDLDGVDVQELARRFTLSVAELEGVEEVGQGLEQVLIAKIESCEQHPNADRLQVCQVNDGSSQLRTVVCGAPNARPGLITALALPGAVLGELKIKTSKVRGVESAGMLCAPDELGLGEGHEGIWELPDHFPVGTPITEVIPARDTLFEVDNKSITHRPDLWGHFGIAREVAGLLGRELKAPSIDFRMDEARIQEAVDIQIQDSDANPRYCALKIEGVHVAPSPPWIQVLLYRCGMRAINQIVDATNFVMLELGNPLHAFDAREVKGQQIRVRRATEGEEVVTLDGQTRTLLASDLLICDAERPVALAGVMGLENSEVRQDTNTLILEAANFRADVIRRTAVRLGLRTEASARYEKSLDPTLTEQAARRFAHIITELCPQAVVVSALSDHWPHPPALSHIDTSVSYINERLGTTLSAEQVRAYLRSIMFEIKDHDGDRMTVSIPSWRATKDISIAEDLVEEVGRLFGYDHITPVQPSIEIPKPYRHPDRTLHRQIKTILSFEAGCHEVQSYSFDVEPLLDRIGRPEVERLELKNPLSSEQRFLRTSLLPSLLGAIERSIAYADELKFYEIGRVFGVGGADLPPQPYHLGGIVWRQMRAHKRLAQYEMSAVAGNDALNASYANAKGLLEHLTSQLGLSVSYHRVQGDALARLPMWLHPARCGEVQMQHEGKSYTLGFVGNLHPDVAQALNLGAYCAGFEWDLTPLLIRGVRYGGYTPIPRFPSVSFDLSVIVPEAVTHDELQRLMLQAKWVKGATCIAVYRGDPVPEGEKSVTFQLLFQADGTLEMEAVNKVVEKLMKRLKNELGGWVRL